MKENEGVFVKRNLESTFVYEAENSKSSYKNEYLIALRKVFSNSTSHAIPNIARTKYYSIKILWSILLVSAIAISTYYIYRSFAAYFSYQVTVTYEYNYESPALFPAVTICNLNPFDSSKSSSFIKETLNNNNINPNIKATDELTTLNLVNVAQAFLKSNVLSNSYQNESLFFEYGFSLDSMLISCDFNGIKCNAYEFQRLYSYDYGNCYTFNIDSSFNSNNLKYTSKWGPSSGLHLELFVGPANESFNLFQTARGVYVSVHNNSKSPSTKYDGIKVPTGYSTDISVSRTFYSKKEHPYSYCRKNLEPNKYDSSYYNLTIQYNIKYSQIFCFDVCIQMKFIYPNCSCGDPTSILPDKNYSFCSTTKDLSCCAQIRNYFDSNSISDECIKYCPLECDSAKYTTSLSSAVYPSTYYFNVIKNDPKLVNLFDKYGLNISDFTIDDMKHVILILNIYYENLIYTNVWEDAALSLETVFALIGGYVGLFLGISVLSLFEVVELLIIYLHLFIEKRNLKRKTNGSNSVLNF